MAGVQIGTISVFGNLRKPPMHTPLIQQFLFHKFFPYRYNASIWNDLCANELLKYCLQMSKLATFPNVISKVQVEYTME
jgi:hypothetical protein